jgi:hypothetical protein
MPFDEARGRGYVLAVTGTYAGLLGQHIAVKQSGGEGAFLPSLTDALLFELHTVALVA